MTPPKLWSITPDTPTAGFEARWPNGFGCGGNARRRGINSLIHERLIAACAGGGADDHPSSIGRQSRDEMTVLYLRDTCEQAGVKTKPVFIEDIGWDAHRLNASWISNALRWSLLRCIRGMARHEEFGAAEQHERVVHRADVENAAQQRAVADFVGSCFPIIPISCPRMNPPRRWARVGIRKPKLSREGAK